MKVITWKEMFEIKGDIVWGHYSEDNFPEQVYIQYNGNLDSGYKRVCDETFPILVPDYEDVRGDHFDLLDRFNETLSGEVSNLETSGDAYNCVDENMKVVVYDKKDIQNWIGKLQSLDINY